MGSASRILVAEDDRTTAITYGTHLIAAGYTVRFAEDGLAALNSLSDSAPSLVILDLQLPFVSGFRILKILKNADDGIPVLVVTSLAFEEAEEVARSGADDFLTKPVDPEILLHKVSRLLSAGRSRIARMSASQVSEGRSISRSETETKGWKNSRFLRMDRPSTNDHLSSYDHIANRSAISHRQRDRILRTVGD